MQKINLRLLLILMVIVFSCNKEVVIDKQSKMTAKINGTFLSANDAIAILAKSTYFSEKGQLTLTGEDDKNKIVITIKDYNSMKIAYTLPHSLCSIAITNKQNGISDTAVNGQLDIKEVISNFYSIPTLASSTFSTGQLYRSEIIAGVFEFATKNNTFQITNGVFGISFNK